MTILDIAVYLSLDELLNLYKSKSFSVTEILSDADEATDSATYLLSLSERMAYYQRRIMWSFTWLVVMSTIE